jgi:hypothetical protein
MDTFNTLGFDPDFMIQLMNSPGNNFGSMFGINPPTLDLVSVTDSELKIYFTQVIQHRIDVVEASVSRGSMDQETHTSHIKNEMSQHMSISSVMKVVKSSVPKLELLFEVFEDLGKTNNLGYELFMAVLKDDILCKPVMDYLFDSYLANNLFWYKEKTFTTAIEFKIPNVQYFFDKCVEHQVGLPEIKIHPLQGQNQTTEWLNKIKYWFKMKHNPDYGLDIIIDYTWIEQMAKNGNLEWVHEMILFLNDLDETKNIPELHFSNIHIETDKSDIMSIINLSRELDLKCFIRMDYPMCDLGDYSVENIVGIDKINFNAGDTRSGTFIKKMRDHKQMLT